MRHGELLLQAVYGACWAMEEGKYHAMLAVLDRWSDGVRLSADEIAAKVGSERKATRAPAGSGVAVLPIFGVISHRAHLVQDISGPGGTSTELVGKDFDAALADPDVGTIVLDIDSPGGNVAGVQELAAKIFAARGQKRVIAVANALAASAAYWIGSAASELVVTPSGEVGSIGVFAVHTDLSRRDRNAGIERTVLKAGRRKAEGNPYEALGADARTYVEQQLGEYYDAFIQAVAQHRSVTPEVARSERFGEGRTVTARQAVQRGLADRIATLDEVFAELGISPRAKGRPVRGGPEAAVSLPDTEPVAGGPPAVRVTLPTFEIDVPAAATPRAAVLHPPAIQGAAGEPLTSLATAPQAKEHPVDESTTAAPTKPAAASPDVVNLQAEMARRERITELGALVNAPSADVQALIVSGATPEQARQQFQQRQAKPLPVQVRVGADRAVEQPFASIGEQLAAILQAGMPEGRKDPRLARYDVRYVAGPTGLNEGIGSEGGYFLDGPLFQGLLEPIYAEDPILSRVTEVPVGEGRNEVKYQVVDETSRATGSRWGGLQMYWVGEGQTATPTKPKTREFRLRLKKLMGVVYATEELKEDGPAAITLVEKAFRAETRFMLCDAIWRGQGGGLPIGWLNAAATVSVAIEATQTIANTPQFIALNTSKMLSRIPADLWNQAIFLYNPELFPYIATATLGGNNVPIFVPGGGMPNRPADTIWGRPAFASEFCEAVGTPGDIALIVPSEYHTAVKDKTAKTAWSPHVRFVYDEDVLKITHRFDGATPWKAAVTPFKGAASRSPFVTLATRA